MRSLPGLLLLFLIAGTGVPEARASVDTTGYRFLIPLSLAPGDAREELYAYRLPPAVYRETQELLADIRLVDEQDQAIPFAILPRMETAGVTQQVEIALERVNFEDFPEENRMAVTYACTNPVAGPVEIRIRTPLRNFEKEVTVQGSRDGKTWFNLVSGAMIFDASRFMDVSNLKVELPESEALFFKIGIHDMTDLQASPISELTRYEGKIGKTDPTQTERQTALHNRDFRIDRIDFFKWETRMSVSRPATAPVLISIISLATNKNNATVVRFQTDRVPLTRLTLQTESRNFSRPFVLKSDRPDRRLDQPQPTLASGTLRRFDFRSLRLEELTMALPESRDGTYELIIENGDNPAIGVTGLAAEGPERQVLFMSSSMRPRLFFGNPTAEKPNLDTTVIQAAIDRGIPPAQVPEAEIQSNPNWKAQGSGFNKKAALWGAMALMALALGAALFKAVCRMDSDSNGSSSAT